MSHSWMHFCQVVRVLLDNQTFVLFRAAGTAASYKSHVKLAYALANKSTSHFEGFGVVTGIEKRS